MLGSIGHHPDIEAAYAALYFFTLCIVVPIIIWTVIGLRHTCTFLTAVREDTWKINHLPIYYGWVDWKEWKPKFGKYPDDKGEDYYIMLNFGHLWIEIKFGRENNG